MNRRKTIETQKQTLKPWRNETNGTVEKSADVRLLRQNRQKKTPVYIPGRTRVIGLNRAQNKNRLQLHRLYTILFHYSNTTT